MLRLIMDLPFHEEETHAAVSFSSDTEHGGFRPFGASEVHYGTKDEATSYAFYTFMRKLGQTVATILINVPLLRIGYNGSELKTEGLSPEALKTMYNFSVIIPAVLFLLVFILLRYVYPLSKKRTEELQIYKDEMMMSGRL